MTYTKPVVTRIHDLGGNQFICEGHNEDEGGIARDFSHDNTAGDECQWEAEDSPCRDVE